MSELKWAEPLLGDVAAVIDPHPSHRAPPEVDGGVPFLGIGDLTERGEVLASSARKVSPRVLEEHKTRYSVASGDIAYGRVATVGKVMRFSEINEPFALSPTMALIQPHGVAASYLAHFLQSKQWDDESAKLLTGTTRSSLGIQLLRKIRISCPRTFEEQEAIGGVLDTLDAAIHETEAIIAKLKAVKKGLLHDLLTRGIDANGELRPPLAEAPHLYKESPLGWIPKDWKVKPLYEVGEAVTGTTPPSVDPLAWGSGTPFITPSEIADDRPIADSERQVSARGLRYVRLLPAKSIVVVCIGSTIGKVGITATTSCTNQQINAVLPYEGIHPDYLFLAISIHIGQLRGLAGLQAVPIVNKTSFESIYVPVAQPPEQIEIAKRLDAISTRIFDEDTTLHKLRLEKAGLMDDLLTGRVRVTPLLAEAEQKPGSA